MYWTDYRWNEGIAVINNHPNYFEQLDYVVDAVSKRLAVFCIKNSF